jgi:hypothetical protein
LSVPARPPSREDGPACLYSPWAGRLLKTEGTPAHIEPLAKKINATLGGRRSTLSTHGETRGEIVREAQSGDERQSMTTDGQVERLTAPRRPLRLLGIERVGIASKRNLAGPGVHATVAAVSDPPGILPHMKKPTDDASFLGSFDGFTADQISLDALHLFEAGNWPLARSSLG